MTHFFETRNLLGWALLALLLLGAMFLIPVSDDAQAAAPPASASASSVR